ncbi:MAG: glycoside hydrolase family 76 protein [Chitinophagaceae bacterium]
MKPAYLFKISLLAFFTASALTSCLKEKDDDGPVPPSSGGGPTVNYDWVKVADSAQLSMNYFWSASDKVYLNSNTSAAWGNYWPNAHALDVLVDAYTRTPSPALKARMDDLMTGVRAKNGNTWLNYYYDDMEWMALACLRAFQATNDNAYRDITNILWADIKNGWSADLGGGIWWRKDNPSKNAPSNLPAAILAARLYKQFNNADDLDWAKKIYAWQKSVLYEAASGWVYDNIDKAGNKNLSWKFTYNQGTFLGAALELYKITGDAAFKNDAIKATDYAVSSGQLTSNAVLKDEGGGDGGLFKGVFVRYLTKLIIDGDLPSDKKQTYLSFLVKNGQSLWSKATNKSLILFNTAWDKMPGNSTDLTTQLSGVMLMESLATLKKLNLID